MNRLNLKHSRYTSRAEADTTEIPKRKLVTIYPYIDTNPYEALLAGSIEQLGAEVIRQYPNRERFPVQLFHQWRKTDVLHLHWVEHLYSARTWGMSVVRTVFFIVLLAVVRLNGTRVVYTLHNLTPHNTARVRYDLFVQRLIINLSHAAIVHSPSQVQIAADALGSKDKYVVIPHGRYDGYYSNEVSKREAREFLKIPDKGNLALFFGGMSDYKGVHKLIQAVEPLAKRNISLMFAGDTSNMSQPEKEALRQLASVGAVHLFEGFVLDDQVQYFMRAADCLVLPYTESFTSGMALLGISFRLPIVGTKAVSFVELVECGLCATCDPENPSSIGDGIEQACSFERQRFEEECNRFLAARSWTEIGQQHLLAYGLTE